MTIARWDEGVLVHFFPPDKPHRARAGPGRHCLSSSHAIQALPLLPPGPRAHRRSNATGLIVRDAYPVSPGHTLIIPRRHIGSFFELTPDERTSLLATAGRSPRRPGAQPPAPACNIGINDGRAAGQTVPHLHIHLIPRYAGDVEDPRGGVRWVMPGKARYW
jgi:diadenosine tetraphosphate (Ap4A) HIT family hydrolase